MKRVFAIAIACVPASVLADNYLGMLKAPPSSLGSSGFYSFSSGPPGPVSLAPDSTRLKLGYKYSRYLAVEGEFADANTRPADVFANPANLSTGFRSTGFGVNTVATLPVWGFSFYGRMGTYRGDRNTLGGYPTSLLADPGARSTRWRYGLGVRYDFTKSLGVRAELERYSNPGLGSPFGGDGESDQVTVGLSWRF